MQVIRQMFQIELSNPNETLLYIVFCHILCVLDSRGNEACNHRCCGQTVVAFEDVQTLLTKLLKAPSRIHV